MYLWEGHYECFVLRKLKLGKKNYKLKILCQRMVLFLTGSCFLPEYLL